MMTKAALFADLHGTAIPIAKGVQFNLGDVLKILVYHDELHIGQANTALGGNSHSLARYCSNTIVCYTP
jgi:hypothetical protein